MIAIVHLVAQQCRRRVNVVDDHVDVAIVEEVAESRAAAGDHVCQAAASGRWHFNKFCAVNVSEELRTLSPSCSPVLEIHFGIDVAVDDKEILQAVVVKIEESGAP